MCMCLILSRVQDCDAGSVSRVVSALRVGITKKGNKRNVDQSSDRSDFPGKRGLTRNLTRPFNFHRRCC